VSARLAVRLTPRGGRDRVEGWARDAAGRAYLKVRVSAPPVDGEANAALVKLIARTLKLPASAVRIAAGDSSRIKQLEIDGLDAAGLTAVFGEPTPD